jgi:hypothetical protein
VLLALVALGAGVPFSLARRQEALARQQALANLKAFQVAIDRFPAPGLPADQLPVAPAPDDEADLAELKNLAESFRICETEADAARCKCCAARGTAGPGRAAPWRAGVG